MIWEKEKYSRDIMILEKEIDNKNIKMILSYPETNNRNH